MHPDSVINSHSGGFQRDFGHEWRGQGWYCKDGDWLLALNVDHTDRVRVELYQGRDPRTLWKDAISLPNRVDGPMVVL